VYEVWLGEKVCALFKNNHLKGCAIQISYLQLATKQFQILENAEFFLVKNDMKVFKFQFMYKFYFLIFTFNSITCCAPQFKFNSEWCKTLCI